MTTKTTSVVTTFDLAVLSTLTVTRKPNKEGRLSFPYLRAQQGDWVMYTFVARPAEIFPMFTVPRCDGKTGYQRDLSEKRAKQIAAYIKKGNPVPGNIVVNIRKSADVQLNGSSKTISFANVENAMSLIDGQHRSWGGALEGDAQFFFTAFLTLEQEIEAGLFLDINGYQKGVPSALACRVRGIAGRQNATEIAINELYDRFLADEDSALYGKLSDVHSRPGMISYKGFMTGVKPVMRINRVKGFDPEQQYTFLNRLFTHAIKIIGEDFFRTNVFGGFLANAERIMTRAIQESGSLKDAAIVAAMQPLNQFDRDAAQTGTRLSKTDVINHIVDLLGDMSGDVDSDDLL